MPQRRVLKIERLSHPHTGQTVTYKFGVRPGSRSRPLVWFEVDEVPAFEGDACHFECERIKGGWTVLQQLEDPLAS